MIPPTLAIGIRHACKAAFPPPPLSLFLSLSVSSFLFCYGLWIMWYIMGMSTVTMYKRAALIRTRLRSSNKFATLLQSSFLYYYIILLFPWVRVREREKESKSLLATCPLTCEACQSHPIHSTCTLFPS